MMVLRFLLFPVALLYGVGVWVRNRLFDWGLKPSHRLPIPVIAIGNLSLGGTGKTPTAAYLLTQLAELGHRPAYLSRGYGRTTQGYRRIRPDQDVASAVGDEALMTAQRFPDLPIAVCEDRVAGGRLLLQEAPDLTVLVLDDAFQHRRIHRDLNILCMDGTRPPRKDFLLPVGRLRETWAAHRRADVLWWNKQGPKAAQELVRYANTPAVAADYAIKEWRPAHPDLQPKPKEGMRGRSAVLVSALGNNAQFRRTVKDAGVTILRHFTYRDHKAYTPEHVSLWQAELTGNPPGTLLLTTEKDLVKLTHLKAWQATELSRDTYALRLKLDVHTGAANLDRLLEGLPKSANTTTASGERP